MKKTTLILSLLSILMMSCNESWLDTVNENQLDASSFMKTEKDLVLSVNAAYTPLGHFGMYGNVYFFVFNALDPYIWHENPNSGFDVLKISKNDYNLQIWSTLYVGLFRTSDILAKMPQMENIVEPGLYARYKAQVRALRGLYYFYLLTIFDRPYYYDETNVPYDPNTIFSNSSQETFWNKIEEDLRFAAFNLPSVWGSADKGRITAGGADAMLGKALLFKYYHYYTRFGKADTDEARANLDSAKVAFERVINNPAYDLMYPEDKTSKEHYYAALLSNSSYLDIPVGDVIYDAENNKESLWEVQYNDDDRGATGALPAWQWGGNRLYEFFSPLGYRNHEIDPNLWFEFEELPAGKHPAGYRRDPRAHATCYLDGDLLDWRKGPDYKFQGTAHTKETVKNFKLYPANLPPISDLDNGGRNTTALGLKKYYYPQFTEKRSPMCAPQNIRIIRYADVLLMYAETLLQLNGDANGDGLIALNKVRDRAGMSPIAALTYDAIRHERTVELATEGHHFFDIIRWQFDDKFNIDLNALFRGYFIYPKNLYFPIPQTEIDLNKGSLVQNPGW
ncbi:MAG: RagB/SusD family nutrient uptake outer membrane protein [Dysgonomonas sp.]